MDPKETLSTLPVETKEAGEAGEGELPETTVEKEGELPVAVIAGRDGVGFAMMALIPCGFTENYF